jgi:hypothetical protein
MHRAEMLARRKTYETASTTSSRAEGVWRMSTAFSDTRQNIVLQPKMQQNSQQPTETAETNETQRLELFTAYKSKWLSLAFTHFPVFCERSSFGPSSIFDRKRRYAYWTDLTYRPTTLCNE